MKLRNANAFLNANVDRVLFSMSFVGRWCVKLDGSSVSWSNIGLIFWAMKDQFIIKYYLLGNFKIGRYFIICLVVKNNGGCKV